jgi:hypothetical protein
VNNFYEKPLSNTENISPHRMGRGWFRHRGIG